MGTKRQLAGSVREIIDGLEPDGQVVDLFAGMGSVAAALAPRWPVTTNDALSFTGAFSRARFKRRARVDVQAVLKRIRGSYKTARAAMWSRYERRLRSEALSLQTDDKLRRYISGATHVGNSPACERLALAASKAKGLDRYQLVSLYFSGGYFSLKQATQLDALRCAIDRSTRAEERDRALAAWIWAASIVVNAPGHTAQFLKANDASSAARVRYAWARDVWSLFRRTFADLRPHGTTAWRGKNRVEVGDALEFLASDRANDLSVVYADPPYTKDQYSRYYHVYETMYAYDFPDSKGEGRYRSDRFVTDFSLATGVSTAFRSLAEGVAARDATLVLSYPSNGLLQQTGGDVKKLLRSVFRSVKVTSFEAKHSTMGGAQGGNVKAATENLYVCS